MKRKVLAMVLLGLFFWVVALAAQPDQSAFGKSQAADF